MKVTLKYNDLCKYIKERFGGLQHFEIIDILKLYFGIIPKCEDLTIDYNKLNEIINFCKKRCNS